MRFVLAIVILASATSAFAQIPGELVGNWFEGNTSILQEKNMTTGSVASRYGSSIGYTFSADGSFRFAGLMKSTLYGCTTTLWNDRRGSVRVSGDVITFVPTKDYWLNTNSCAPSSDKSQNKPVQTISYNYEVGVKEGRTWLCMREVGKTAKEDIRCFPKSND